MSYWSFYFLIKVALHYAGYIGMHWLPNLLFALALMLPAPPMRWLRVARQALAWMAAIGLLYYDSYLPSFKRVLSEIRDIGGFSPAYLAELFARIWDWKIVLGLAALLALYAVLSRRVRFATFALGGILSVPLVAALTSQPGTQMAASAAPATSLAGGAGAQTVRPGAPMDLNAQLQAFYAHENQRHLERHAAGAPPAFDIILLHVCSLSWDDLDFTGMRDAPLLQHFDAVFTQFNSAASYSGPAMLRVLRGNCGQAPHDDLYKSADPSCYVFPSLEQLGYETHALLNHDGHFGGFAKLLQADGGLAGKLDSSERAPVQMRSFDGTPVYEDQALLSGWYKQHQSAQRPLALYYNTITLHDGNRTPDGKSSNDTYKPRLARLLTDFDQFIGEIERSGRKAVVILVPEHGAALRSDKLQISGMREIPSPRITIVPAAMKIVGMPKSSTANGGPMIIDQPISYFGLNVLLDDLLRDSPFSAGSRPLAERMAHLETTSFESENAGTVVMRDAAGQYWIRADNGTWVPQTP